MKISFTKVATISVFMLASFNGNATVITGGLSYDDSLTRTITGTNGLTYVGWAEAASYNYAQTLAATKPGGLYESYHIANQVEAGEFFSLATSVDVAEGYGSVRANGPKDSAAFGDHSSSSGVWFLIDLNRGRQDVGVLSINGDNQFNPFMQITTNEFAYNIAHTDRHSASGSISSRLRSWLLVSGPVPTAHPIPAPVTSTLLGLGLLGLWFARKHNNLLHYSQSKAI